jgi:hypothetical protein
LLLALTLLAATRQNDDIIIRLFLFFVAIAILQTKVSTARKQKGP